MPDNSKLIINLAPTGMVPRKSDTPHVPTTPDEIAADAKRCVEAGASIVHLHAREADGKPTFRKDLYAEIIGKVREACAETDVIICVSCSGRDFKAFEQRSQVLELEGDLRPEMASLTLGSMNFPTQASINDPAMIKDLAQKMDELNVTPEWEAFDLGMIDYAKFLIGRGILKQPYYCNILLGSLGTLAATPYNLVSIVNALPEGTTWAATGIGRFQFPVNALAITMGGNVRVGIEDSLYMDATKNRLATNVDLVKRLANLARAYEREIATPAEAREMIGLKPRTPQPLSAQAHTQA